MGEPEKVRSGQTQLALLISTAAMIGLLVTVTVGVFLSDPAGLVVLAAAFLVAMGTSGSAVWARVVILREESLRADLFALLILLASQSLALLLFLATALLIFPSWLTHCLLWPWLTGLVIYTFASASPGIRVILTVGILLLLPASLFVVYIAQSRHQSRENKAYLHGFEIYRAFQERRDIEKD